MPCTSQPTASTLQRQRILDAIKRLDLGLEAGAIKPVIGAAGSIAFHGWGDREGVSDLCAYRALAAANSPALRRAVMRAEAISGRRLDARAIGAGVHSHDGGATWGTH